MRSKFSAFDWLFITFISVVILSLTLEICLTNTTPMGRGKVVYKGYDYLENSGSIELGEPESYMNLVLAVEVDGKLVIAKAGPLFWSKVEVGQEVQVERLSGVWSNKGHRARALGNLP